jgi:hypothetical protein
MKRNKIGIISLQTDNTLLLADKDFVTKEEKKLYKVGFLMKKREKLTATNLIKFNRGYLIIEGDNLMLTQK